MAASKAAGLVLLALVCACGQADPEPPRWIRLAQGFVPKASASDSGNAVDGVWRVTTGEIVGEGIPVHGGASEELVLDVAPECALRFTLHAPASEENVRAPGVFHVTLDGREIFEGGPRPGSAEFHVVELPASGARAARLAFSVDGGGLGVFFAPTIGPREIGKCDARPWEAKRDIVLFLADTFRADNLALHGGPVELAPCLNALAARSVAFLQPRSTATWTLPAVASLFTASTPPQHGAVGTELSLSSELTTIAEQLGAHGYRTAAITDSYFVSRRYGLDQGFEWFQEIGQDAWDLDRTLAEARELIGRDDGRPLFLFVHTYRAHKPYRVGPMDDAEPYHAAERGAAERASDKSRPGVFRQMLAEAATFRELYRAGVRELDANLGAWFSELETRGLFRRGLFVFTSDHGESFGEHGELMHRGRPYEVQVRVPLLLFSGSLAPRVEPALASLVDLPLTLARWAEVEPAPEWTGRDLLGPADRARAFVYRINPWADVPAEAAAYQGAHKVFAALELGPPPVATLKAAFDLERDPDEALDALHAGATWPGQVFDALRAELEASAVRAVLPEAVELDAEQRAELDDLGYVEDDR